MIVDDEENTRNLIQLCIDWEAIGIEIIGQASSGLDALEQLESLQPDLIITDIRMPFMDGLELSKNIIEQYPHIGIIVLTAYDEFQYAQQGVKLGIDDFILKPINRMELKETVLSVQERLTQTRINEQEYEVLKEQAKENFVYLREKFLLDWIYGHYNQVDYSDSIMDLCAYYELNNLKNYCQVACIEVIPKEEWSDRSENTIIFHLHYKKLVTTHTDGKKDLFIVLNNNLNLVLICANPDIDFTSYCNELKNYLRRNLHCNITIGISSKKQELYHLHTLYKEAMEALKHKMLYGYNQVIEYDETHPHSDTSESIHFDDCLHHVQELGFYLKTGMIDKALASLGIIMRDIQCDTTVHSLEHMHVIGIHVVTQILNVMVTMHIDHNKSLLDYKPYKKIFDTDTLMGMHRFLSDLVISTAKDIDTLRKNRSLYVINEIKDYLKSNYQDTEISLKSTASKFFLNSSYLSRQFKAETNSTFTEYLTRIRINKAAELIQSTDLKVYELAQAVGIPDSNYFGKCFKKYYGMTIKEYRS